MSENLERALDALSDPNQHTSEASYGSHVDPSLCWRCFRGPVNEVGVCDRCAAWLRGEFSEDPASWPTLQAGSGSSLYDAGGTDPAPAMQLLDEVGRERIRFDTEGITFLDDAGTPHLFIPADGSGIYRVVDGAALQALSNPEPIEREASKALLMASLAYFVAFLAFTLAVVAMLR